MSQISKRDKYPHFLKIPTRWMDNDVYGHVNNVVYYSYFDTVVNQFLIEHAGLDPHRSREIGVVVETMCRYFKELSFPEVIDAGLVVLRLGQTSVTYQIGLFRDGDEEPAATGHFVHVYIDRATRQPISVPDATRDALAPLCVESEGGEDAPEDKGDGDEESAE